MWSSGYDLLHVTFQASRLLRSLLVFWNICGNLTYSVTVNSQDRLQPMEYLLFSIRYLLIFKESVLVIQPLDIERVRNIYCSKVCL